MAGDVVIRVEGLGKRYIIGHEVERERYTALRDVAARAARNMWKRTIDAVRGRALVRGEATEEFWALKDVSFEVKRGEVLGIIGRNGAGKSTLLKILSRITEPTEGRVTIAGRVASLLEVGTGFHPELTGRENIYLNGAILGMSRSEIRRKFDEIVDFSGVEKFMDTPVKRYSSGMQVRLAFSVAAHLEPEILIVDEVLAVGDFDFQKKCLNKMEEVTGRDERTVLFVSHNMAAIRALCSRVLLLEKGRPGGLGNVDELSGRYLGAGAAAIPGIKLSAPKVRTGPYIEEINLTASTISFGECIDLELALAAPRAAQIGIEIEIHDQRGTPVAYVSTSPMLNDPIAVMEDSRMRLRLRLGPLALATGRYDLYFRLIQPWVEDFHIVEAPVRFEVVESDPGRTGFEFRQAYNRGAFTVPLTWHFDA
jgi:lipopolysaccharide transport system ATP-binding protein